VRVAALEGLGRAGGAADVALLSERAAMAPPAEQAAARHALARATAAGVDAAIVESLARAGGKVQLELIRAAGERGIAAAAPALIKAARTPTPDTRRASLRALRDVAPPAEAAALTALLLQCGEDDRADCERALSHTMRRAVTPDLQPVVQAFRSTASAEARVSLLNVLGSVAAPDALPVLREAMSAPEAEVRRAAVAALGEWPAAEPLKDLIEAARSHSDPAIRVLALRGYVRLVRLPAERPASETAGLLAAAMQAATRPDEKRLVLAAAQRYPCAESLALVRAASADPALAAEVQAATKAIEAALAARGR
jgi:HEAT repeat protein